jgi:hypothetical protein
MKKRLLFTVYLFINLFINIYFILSNKLHYFNILLIKYE